jgi:ubiquinone/menaquinone biosynthesis C-methylase UbiE
MPGMNEFDLKASGWDENPIHHARSEAIAKEMLRLLPINKEMSAMEFGAGTGILSFMLKDFFNDIILMDSSIEMVNVANKKIDASGAKNLKTIVFDLEHEIYSGKPLDLIFTQMVLHHVNDIEKLLGNFYKILNPNGFIAIADLYTEDGSFHDEGFSGHNGFNIEDLTLTLNKCNFRVSSAEQCFTINRKISEKVTNQYPVFLLIANRIH